MTLAALVLFAAWPQARAETTLCREVTSVPTVISESGVHCFFQDLSSAVTMNSVIRIDANNVTLDCNGHKLGGLAAGAGTEAFGIYAENRKNITIRNCSIRGFHMGVFLTGPDSAYHLVEDNSFDGNTDTAIHVIGDGSTIRRNQVRDTGGSTASSNPGGISFAGDGTDAIDNTVDGVAARAGSNDDASGIRAFTGTGVTIGANRVRNLRPDGAGDSRGISINGISGVISGNTVSAPVTGTGVAIGISCADNSSAARGNALLGYGDGFEVFACTGLDNASD